MPLAVLGNQIILYKKGMIYFLNEKQLNELCRLYAASWKDTNRILVRLFRREPKYAVSLDADRILIAAKKKIFLVNIRTKEKRVVIASRKGFSDPLNICPVSGKWLAIWGDYGTNEAHGEVYIYGLTSEMTVERIYRFEAGAVRHIHNIVPKKGGGYYIFTGDWEENAGIYESDSDFRMVVPKKTGEQRYRAVIGFDTVQGLLFATDAVNEENYIYILKKGEEIVPVRRLNGSCIYGTQFNAGYLFSTTVEPDENKRGVLSWFSRKRGAGILTNDVELVYVDNDLNCKVLRKYKKDFWPMKLMQYGKILFPYGNFGDRVLIYPVAVKKFDGIAEWIGEKLI